MGKCWRDQWAHTRRGAHLASLIPLQAVTEALLRDETYRGKILTEDPVGSWPRKRTLEENLVKSGEIWIKQCFSTSVLLTFWARSFFWGGGWGVGRRPVHGRMFRGTPGLYPLFPCWQHTPAPVVTIREGQQTLPNAPCRSPLGENHWNKAWSLVNCIAPKVMSWLQ